MSNERFIVRYKIVEGIKAENADMSSVNIVAINVTVSRRFSP